MEMIHAFLKLTTMASKFSHGNGEHAGEGEGCLDELTSSGVGSVHITIAEMHVFHYSHFACFLAT